MSKSKDHTFWPRWATVFTVLLVLLWWSGKPWIQQYVLGYVPITIEWELHAESYGIYDFAFFYSEKSRNHLDCNPRPFRQGDGWIHCYDGYVEVDRRQRSHTFLIKPGNYYFTAIEYRDGQVSNYGNEIYLEYKEEEWSNDSSY